MSELIEKTNTKTEVAAASVTVIDKDPLLFLRSLGEEVGRFMVNMHREKGVRFCLESLRKGTFLNDGIIDRYLLHLVSSCEGIAATPNSWEDVHQQSYVQGERC